MRSIFPLGLGLAAAVLLLPACGDPDEVPPASPAIGPWARTYGGTASDLSSFGRVVAGPTSHAVAGRLNNNSLGWVLRLNLDGTVAWQKSYASSGTTLTGFDAAPGGYVFAASTTAMGAGATDAWVVRLDVDGNIAWQKTYGGPGDDYGRYVRPTSDGGFVVLAGSTTFNGGPQNLWILKLASDGSLTWQKTLLNPYTQYATGIHELPGGGYIVASQSTVGPTGDDASLLRLNADGSLAWQKRYGTPATTQFEGAWAVVPTLDAGFLFVGSTQPPVGGVGRGWAVKVDAAGAILWQKSYGAGTYEALYAVEALPDGSFLLGGVADAFQGSPGSKLWLLQIDAAGAITWQKKYGGAGGQDAAALARLPSGRFLVQGNTTSFGAGVTDFWLLNIAADGDCGNLDTVSTATAADTAATAVTPALTLGDTSIVPANTGVVPVPTFHVSTSQVP